jgi:tetratricopeptide (TPR) repeat protein
MKEKLGTARLRRNFAPLRSDGKVSMRELQVPAKARDELERGLRRLAKRDAIGSLRHFDAAIRVSPEYYKACYNEGVAEMQLRNNEAALRRFQNAVELSGGSYANAELGYGLALLREGRAEEAERDVRHGLESERNNADGHVVLGFVWLKLNRQDEAEQNGNEALDTNGRNSVKGYLVLSDVDAAKRNYTGQVRYLDAYLKLCPHDPNKTTLQTVRDLAKKTSGEAATDREQVTVGPRIADEGCVRDHLGIHTQIIVRDSCRSPYQRRRPFLIWQEWRFRGVF